MDQGSSYWNIIFVIFEIHFQHLIFETSFFIHHYIIIEFKKYYALLDCLVLVLDKSRQTTHRERKRDKHTHPQIEQEDFIINSMIEAFLGDVYTIAL